jgi:hypothetical protein
VEEGVLFPPLFDIMLIDDEYSITTAITGICPQKKILSEGPRWPHSQVEEEKAMDLRKNMKKWVWVKLLTQKIK